MHLKHPSCIPHVNISLFQAMHIIMEHATDNKEVHTPGLDFYIGHFGLVDIRFVHVQHKLLST